MVGVEQWAELRREHFVRGVSIKALARRTGLSRNTVRAALRSAEPPGYRRAPAGSKLDPFKDEIHRQLKKEPEMPSQRVRELIEPSGSTAARRSLTTTCARCGRCLRRRGRFSGRSAGRARSASSTSGSRARRSRSGTANPRRMGRRFLSGFSRAGAGTLIFSKQTLDLLFGIRRCFWALGALPQTLVWDRQAGLHAGGGRPTEAFAAFCGQLKVGWHFCAKDDPQAKGAVERLQGARAAARSRSRSARSRSTTS